MADTIIGEGGFEAVCIQAFENLDSATKQYESGLIQLQESAGQSFEEIQQGIDNTIVDTNELINVNDELIDRYNEQLLAIQDIITEMDNLIQKYQDAEEAARNATQAAYAYQQAENSKNANDAANQTLTEETTSTTGTTSTSSVTTTSTTANTNSLGYASNGAPFIASYTVKKGDTLSGIGANYGVSWKRIYAENKSTIGSNANKIYPGQVFKIPKYASGGYTGDWAGDSGQLAMLHKKELVLNANDTKNMLNIISIVRDITANLNASVLGRLAGVTAGVFNGATNEEILEQNVHITAEFPNATSSKEIEDALNNLVNRASQEIHKN